MSSKLKRGCLVNIIFVVLAIGSVINIFSYPINQYASKMLPQSLQNDSITVVVSTVVGIVTLISLIGTLKWNKTSIYALILISVVSAVFRITKSGVETLTIISGLVSIIIPLIYSFSLLKILKSNGHK